MGLAQVGTQAMFYEIMAVKIRLQSWSNHLREALCLVKQAVLEVVFSRARTRRYASDIGSYILGERRTSVGIAK
jgi:hypothetical protein